MTEKAQLFKICIFCYPDELLTPSLRSYANGVAGPPSRSVSGFIIPTKFIKMDNSYIQLILVDISTNPVFEGVKNPSYPNYIRGASAAIFAFSKGNHSFIKSALDHYHEFRQHIPDSTLPVIFIGLHNESEVVTLAEGQSLAQNLSADYYEMAVDDLQTLDKVLHSISRKVIAFKMR